MTNRVGNLGCVTHADWRTIDKGKPPLWWFFCVCQEAESFFGTAVIDTNKDGTIAMRMAHFLKPHGVANVVKEPVPRVLIGFSNQHRPVGNDVTTFSAFHHNLPKEQ